MWRGGLIIHQKSKAVKHQPVGKKRNKQRRWIQLMGQQQSLKAHTVLWCGVYWMVFICGPAMVTKEMGQSSSHLRESWVTNSLSEPQEPLELQAPSVTCYTARFCTISSKIQKKPLQVISYSDFYTGNGCC